MLNFNIRHFRDLSATYIDYLCKYPRVKCTECPNVHVCDDYTKLATAVQKHPFNGSVSDYISLARLVVRWAEASNLTHEKGYMEAIEYLNSLAPMDFVKNFT